MEKVSIIIPVYNTADYLSACLDSILSQTYKNFEIILIDDGSTDESGTICDIYASKDPRIVVCHKKNAGVSTARNCGLEIASGDFYAFFDSDDTVLPNMIEDLVRELVANKADIIQSAGFVGEKPDTGQILFLNKDEALTDLFLYERKIQPSMCLGLYRNELFKNNYFPSDIHYFEDYAMQCNVVSKSKGVILLGKSYYSYRQREGSATRSGMTEKRWTMSLIPDYLERLNVYRNANDNRVVRYYFFGFWIFRSVLLTQSTAEDKAKLRRLIWKNVMSILFAKGIPPYKRISVALYAFFPKIITRIFKKRKNV